MPQRRTASPRQIKARFDSICPETGLLVKAGDTCVYYPSQHKVYHTSSKTAEQFRSNAFSTSWGMADANW